MDVFVFRGESFSIYVESFSLSESPFGDSLSGEEGDPKGVGKRYRENSFAAEICLRGLLCGLLL